MMDKYESRFEQLVRFAKEAGFRKLDIAFCISLSEEASIAEKLLRKKGFEVESCICKVGHFDRNMVGVEDPRLKPMCNPIAQAKYLNDAQTEFNVVIGLCVGHDTLFYKYSNAPCTTLLVKDHIYHHQPGRYFEEHNH